MDVAFLILGIVIAVQLVGISGSLHRLAEHHERFAPPAEGKVGGCQGCEGDCACRG